MEWLKDKKIEESASKNGNTQSDIFLYIIRNNILETISEDRNIDKENFNKEEHIDIQKS